MEVTRTVRVKLDVPAERRADLHATIEQFLRAANYAVEHGRTDDGYFMLSRRRLHDAIYYDLREETDLPANLCIRAYSHALSAVKSTVADWKAGRRRPPPEFTAPLVVYDKQTLTIGDRSATLSTVDGRVPVDYVLGEHQAAYLDDDEYERRMGTLHYDEAADRFYLHVVIKKEVAAREGGRVLGVDLNLKNVAVTSTGTFYDGGTLLWRYNHGFRVRRSLQRKGTRSARQTLGQLSERETRFALDRLHTISRRIVAEAESRDCAYIAVEDLTHIRKRLGASDDRTKRQLHEWAFRTLQDQLEYKAAEYGIRVVAVDPAYTSQECSRCGHRATANRDRDGWFECVECGYSVDGDYNAAKNVGFRLLTLPAGERPAGLGDGQLALKSGTVTPSGRYAPHDPDGSSKGESTDKSTPSVDR